MISSLSSRSSKLSAAEKNGPHNNHSSSCISSTTIKEKKKKKKNEWQQSYIEILLPHATRTKHQHHIWIFPKSTNTHSQPNMLDIASSLRLSLVRIGAKFETPLKQVLQHWRFSMYQIHNRHFIYHVMYWARVSLLNETKSECMCARNQLSVWLDYNWDEQNECKIFLSLYHRSI